MGRLFQISEVCEIVGIDFSSWVKQFKWLLTGIFFLMTIDFWLPGHFRTTTGETGNTQGAYLQEGAPSFSSFLVGFPYSDAPKLLPWGTRWQQKTRLTKIQACLLQIPILISLAILITPDMSISGHYHFHHFTLGWDCTVPEIDTWKVTIVLIIWIVCLQVTKHDW